jgi:uncharacterized protein (DUF1015 family)
MHQPNDTIQIAQYWGCRWHTVIVPRFLPFRALRYAPTTELSKTCAPPYDVLNDSDRANLVAQHQHNIVNIDLPIATSNQPDAYQAAAHILNEWIEAGVLVRDELPSFTLYRMQFRDTIGNQRNIVGVLGGIEVVDEGAGDVLPHERTTPKAKTDRLDLTRATDANLSPVWGLSLAPGLSEILKAPAEVVGSYIDEQGVTHTVERVGDPAHIAAISDCIAKHPVIIADGHHRYAISRTYRDETRLRTNSTSTDAEQTLTFVNELIDEQLSVAAIHRLYTDVSAETLLKTLEASFTVTDAPPINPKTLATMEQDGCLCFIDRDLQTKWLTPRTDAFDGIRSLDSARLEHALRDLAHTVSFQHGVTEVADVLSQQQANAAILIRPVSVAEIKRTATEGILMPPKSTFFTPKLRTGFVIRELNTRD